MIYKSILSILILIVLASCSVIEYYIPNECDYGLENYYFTQVKEFKEKNIPINSIIMVGNSLTAGGNWKVLFPDIAIENFGIPGDSTYGVLFRTPQIIEKKPSKIFLLISVNDLRIGCLNEQIIDNYKKILYTFKSNLPNTKVYIQSMLPTNGKVRDNDQIKNVNIEIKKLAMSTNHVYIDMYDKFLESGKTTIDPKLTYDGIHLTNEGYLLWAWIIDKYVKE